MDDCETNCFLIFSRNFFFKKKQQRWGIMTVACCAGRPHGCKNTRIRKYSWRCTDYWERCRRWEVSILRSLWRQLRNASRFQVRRQVSYRAGSNRSDVLCLLGRWTKNTRRDKIVRHTPCKPLDHLFALFDCRPSADCLLSFVVADFFFRFALALRVTVDRLCAPIDRAISNWRFIFNARLGLICLDRNVGSGFLSIDWLDSNWYLLNRWLRLLGFIWFANCRWLIDQWEIFGTKSSVCLDISHSGWLMGVSSLQEALPIFIDYPLWLKIQPK